MLLARQKETEGAFTQEVQDSMPLSTEFSLCVSACCGMERRATGFRVDPPLFSAMSRMAAEADLVSLLL